MQNELKGETMKTEFLKSLGIEDREVINKIMAENGKDINNARTSAGDFSEERQRLSEEYTNQLQEVRKEYAVKMALHQAGARDLTSVLAHINMDVIRIDDNERLSGLDEQIDLLTKNESTSFLFQDTNSTPSHVMPIGTRPGESFGELRLNWAPFNRELGNSESSLESAVQKSYKRP